MIGDLISCAREDCGLPFHKLTHNQKYCCNECCRIETNRKIMEKYHENKARQKGKHRACRDCGTKLSRYNPSKVCGACENRLRESNLGAAQQLVTSVSWL